MYKLKMNYLNLCLKLPNLGIIIYHLVFILIIPYICIAFRKTASLKYYWPFLVGFANILTLSYEPHLFKNLYQLVPENRVSFVSSNIINLIAIMGIIWQCIDISVQSIGNPMVPVLSGLIMFLCAFPLSREGIKFIVNKSKKLFKNNNSSGSKLLVGISTLIIIIAFNLIGLQMAKNMGSKLIKMIPNARRMGQRIQPFRAQLGVKPPAVKPPAVKPPAVKAPLRQTQTRSTRRKTVQEM